MIKLKLEKSFVEVVGNVAGAVGKNGVLEVAIRAKKKDSAMVILTANNTSLEITSYISVDAEIDEEIEKMFERKIYIDYLQFSRLLSVAFTMEEKVDFIIQGENDYSLVIGDNTFSVKAVTEAFASFPVIKRENFVNLKVSRLKEMAGLVRNATSEKDITDKVILRIKDNKFSTSSSDAYTASISYMSLEDKADDKESIVFGKDLLAVVNKLSGDDIQLDIGEKDIVLVNGNVKCTIRRVACNPLQVEKLFALPEGTKQITFDRQLFLNYLKLLDIYKDNKFVVGIKTESGIVSLETNGHKISVEAEASGDAEVYVNGQYFVEVFSKLKTEKVTINITGSLSPIIVDVENDKILFLPVNMKVNKAKKEEKK